MLRAFIVDDEPLARDELSYLLNRCKVIEIAGETDNVKDAIEQLPYMDADVIFLDIQLAEESGLELAERIQNMVDRPEIVFATAYDEYALKAFELSAFDYILKPFEENRVHQTILKLQKSVEAKKGQQFSEDKVTKKEGNAIEKLAVTLEDRIALVKVNDILYLTSEEGKTIIATSTMKYEAAESLVAFERKLTNTSLFRVHRAFLVNLDQVKELQPWFHSTYNLIMQDGASVPVSRTYTKELKKRIGL
ncbi:LytR/AlgR family response regulator transcription factor [Bacillus massiliigorillae]|uniref:LytR/AlgR family response regulator transcription factor n=1 Tax=Bacillus massiliigorillae TaxID=1243664 RepID=UPI0003A15769|nr:LytTR family transcriptional regulator DNA-binding domain-containing protein [Bacillus massiliigorillae]